MSVSNLTGTRWQFNSIISPPPNTFYTITFKDAYNTSGTNVQIYNTDVALNYSYTLSGSTQRYNTVAYTWSTSTWASSQGLSIVEFWGGTAATNANLISWVESNATQIPLSPYLTNIYDLAQVGHAIRSVTGTSALLSYPSAMVNALNNIGDFWTIEQLMSTDSLGSLYYNGSITTIPSGAFAYKNITTASFPYCTKIELHAFDNCSILTDISFPECGRIGWNAFYNCYSLTEAYFPKCSYLGMSAFTTCTVMTTASFPECTSIGASAFTNCYKLNNISFPKCISIGNNAFYGCSSLTAAVFPSCTSIDTYAFYNCSALTTISFPLFSSILSGNIFNGCHQLSSIYMPLVTGLSYYTFAYCSALSKINFSYVSFISGGSTFRNCISLSEVIFPALNNISVQYNFTSCYNLVSLNLTGVSVVPSLQFSNNFYSTPIAGYTTSTGGVYGSIYVPASLYDAFTSATNWTYFSSRMVSV